MSLYFNFGLYSHLSICFTKCNFNVFFLAPSHCAPVLETLSFYDNFPVLETLSFYDIFPVPGDFEFLRFPFVVETLSFLRYFSVPMLVKKKGKVSFVCRTQNGCSTGPISFL